VNSFYYAVIFSSQRNSSDHSGYERMTDRMVELAKDQKGFLGIESSRGNDGFGITVSYWKSQEDIAAWKANTEHKIAQEFGRSKWYDSFMTRICKVEREYSSGKVLP
jgi:heme-degrading monooxygenase HmoA